MPNNFSKIESIIFNHNPIDLLAKLSYLSWMMKTDAFSDLDEQSFTFLQVKEALYYVLAFLFSHQVSNINENKISFDDLSFLIKSIYLDNISKENEENNLNHISRKLCYTQKESGEILPSFFSVPFQHILSAEDSLILEKYKCNSSDLLNDFRLFCKRIFSAVSTKGIRVSDFINKFDEFCTWKNLMIPFHTKCYDFWNFISSKIGEIDEHEFNPCFPLSLIKKHRKLFLQYQDSIFCFDLELIPNLIVRCVERSLQHDKKQNPTWDSNMKGRTESLVANAFSHYFKNGYCHTNLEFKNPEFKGESDILFEYGGYLFIVEVKSNKLSPDPVNTNTSTVYKSFVDSVGKAESQCSKVEKHIIKYGSSFYDKKNTISLKYDSQHLIKVVVTFEELSAVLPDENIQKENHTILLNYYDLLIVFNFIQDSLLILKYFLERRKNIKFQFEIADEMIYLGLFRENINFVEQLNSQEMPNDEKVSIYILDPTSFTHDIEMFYTDPQNNTKPKITINDFQKILVKSFDGNADRKDRIILFLLSLPSNFSNQLMNMYYRNNDDFRFAPQCSLLPLKNGDFIGIMISRRHKGIERYTYYAVAKRFFKIHGEAKSIISFIKDEKEPYFEIINVNQKELNYQKTNEELARIQASYGFKQPKLI